MRLTEGDTFLGGRVVIDASNGTALVSGPNEIEVWREVRGYKEHDCIVTNNVRAVCLDCNVEYNIATAEEIFPYIRLFMQFPDSCNSDSQKI